MVDIPREQSAIWNVDKAMGGGDKPTGDTHAWGLGSAWEGKRMLRNARQLENFVVQATDGELGTGDQLYFEDQTWGIRYLTVAIGFLGERRVLISPISASHVDWIGKRLGV